MAPHMLVSPCPVCDSSSQNSGFLCWCLWLLKVFTDSAGSLWSSFRIVPFPVQCWLSLRAESADSCLDKASVSRSPRGSLSAGFTSYRDPSSCNDGFSLQSSVTLTLCFRQADLSDCLWSSHSFQTQEPDDYQSVLLFAVLTKQMHAWQRWEIQYRGWVKKESQSSKFKFLCDSGVWIR